MVDILCIKTNDYVKEYKSPKDPIEFFQLVYKDHYWVDRPKAEMDESYLQIIPYIAVIRYNKETRRNQIFQYERLNKGNESRLHSKKSIGIGGHIDWEENSGTVLDIINKAAIRELREELIIDSNDFELSYKTVWFEPDYSTKTDKVPVGNVHIGLFATVELLPDTKIEINEIEKIAGEMIYREDLDVKNMENWSKGFIDTILWKYRL